MRNNHHSFKRAGLMGLTLATLGINAHAALVNIDTVYVGDAGNADASAANTTHGKAAAYGYGGVDHDYRMGTTEITINQYVAFLNAVATNAGAPPLSIGQLWKPNMKSVAQSAGIDRIAGATAWSYVAIGDGERPIANVTWMDAARFANWMNNGATVGASTETGAYTLNYAFTGTFTKNENAKWWIPTEDEWYKAAYYDPSLNNGQGGYRLEANQSDSMTSHDPAVAGAANFAYVNPGSPSAPSVTLYPRAGNLLTVVGLYNTPSYYGTYDQAGNVEEFTDAATGVVCRGGSAAALADGVDAAFRTPVAANVWSPGSGFRLAQAVPEPSTFGLLAIGLLSIASLTRQRKTR